MSLINRLCGFFLVSLAFVLVGFSAILLVLAGLHLDRQLETRTAAALDILSAGVEVADEGFLEWEPNDRYLAIGRDPLDPEIRWFVADKDHRVIDGSSDQIPQTAGWKIVARKVGQTPDAFTISVAVSRKPGDETWNAMLLTVVLLSLGVWSICAGMSRAICRRALAPLLQMTEESRAMSAEETSQRLSDPKTNDELSALASEFNRLLTRRHEAFERQSRFTGNASHQLRTPLAAMLGQIEVSLRRERDPAEYRRVLGLVGERANHLKRIVDLMLFLARANAETIAPDLHEIDLTSWLDETMKRHAGHPRASDFQCIFGHEPLYVKANSVMLDELFDILLDNAAKYSDPGSPIEIGIAKSKTDDRVRFEVTDHGFGIPSSELPQLFEAFHRGQEARRRGLPGVGLGLSVAGRIAQALQAETEVQTEPGVGSTFVIRFASLVDQAENKSTEVPIPV